MLSMVEVSNGEYELDAYISDIDDYMKRQLNRMTKNQIYKFMKENDIWYKGAYSYNKEDLIWFLMDLKWNELFDIYERDMYYYFEREYY